MKQIILLLISALLVQMTSKAQLKDSMLVKKLSVHGVCLCRTTLSDLKREYSDLKEIDVEEMDMPKNCYGQDSRFISGKGYYTQIHPGIIFQKDQESDYISKIRLNKNFKGGLPDGKRIDMEQFRLKDLFVLYPKLKDKWGSRGCSDYWNFSNDTVSFYVKIDKSKQPQFPIDEEYYMKEPIEGIDLTFSCYGIEKNETDNPIIESAKTDPVFFIDSVRINKSGLLNYNPSDIASVTVYKDTNATKRFGEEAKYGLIYIETKTFAKNRYWKYFSSKSQEYRKLVASPDNDSNVQYILNKRILKENYEGDLASINDKIFKGLQIINKAQLVTDYSITDKDFGVIISSEVPQDLIKGKK